MTRSRIITGAVVLLVLGLVELLVGLVRGELIQFALGDFALTGVGIGSLLELLSAGSSLLFHDALSHGVAARVDTVFGPTEKLHVAIGAVLWVAGWAGLALTLRSDEVTVGPRATAVRAPSEAVGKPLNARLAQYRDFHWSTLAAYGFGIFFAEVGFIGSYMALVAKGTGTSTTSGLSPVAAFVVAFAIGLGVAFAGGFVGAMRSKRLSTPEATMALLYFGLPVPVVLSLMHAVPDLMLAIGYRLREVVYLSSLLGEARPELGYWLITSALALSLFLGINFGFVSTSTGKLDLRASYELFIAGRHVSVFRPRLLGSVFAVLILGIVPPLIIYAFVSAAEAVVERARVRQLGLLDPLRAAEAMNDLKLRAQTPTAMMTALSVGGVGVGVMALIIVLSVMSGFEADLQKKILGTNSHGLVMKYSPDMPEYAEVMEKISKVRGVAGQTPFILNEVMVSSEGNVSGSMIKGIDPLTVGTVTDLPSYMLPGGTLEGLENPKKIKLKHFGGGGALDDKPSVMPDKGEKPVPGINSDIARDPLIDTPAPADEVVLPGIVVGRELAASLKVVVGDRLNVISPVGGELGPQGPTPKSRPFRVAGIFYSGMFEYDSKFVYIHLREAQTFFNVKGASGVEIKVVDVDNARNVMKSIYDGLEGYPYRTKDWGEMNRNLFAALRLEKLVMGIILSIIVIVAAGLIVATVIMLVLEKRKEIAVLKALGVPDGGIVKIFLIEGLQIGVAGGILGLIAGLAWCVFIEKVGIKLDPQVYYIPALPVRIEPFQTALSVVIAILVTFLASIYPALKASQVEPVDGLKSE